MKFINKQPDPNDETGDASKEGGGCNIWLPQSVK